MLRQHISEAKKPLLSESSGTSSGMTSKRRMPPKASPVVNAKPQKRSFSSAMIAGLLGNKMDELAFEREALDVMLARRLLMRVCLLWGATLPITLLAPPMTALINTALISLGAWRLAEVVGFWRYRADLEGVPLVITPFETLLEKLALCLKQASQRTACLKTFDAKRFDGEITSLYLGEGFLWTPEKSQRLYRVCEKNTEALRVPTLVRRALALPPALSQRSVGSGLLHGVGLREEAPIVRALSSLGGGTLIVGTTQAGKGVVMTSLVAQAILRNEPVIVIDPKSSKRLRGSIRAACQLAHRDPPLEFHPAFPQSGVRLDPLGSWSRATEIAGRITAMLPGDDNVFREFGWSAVNVVVQGLFFLFERPNLVKLRRVLEEGIDQLLARAIKKDLLERGPRDWEERLDSDLYPKENRFGNPIPECDRLVALWEDLHREELMGAAAEAIRPMIAVFRHNRDHYTKITASLQPILAMLTTGSLATTLSPDAMDEEDPRPIVTLERVIESRGVLYLGLDALPDATVAGALGSLLLSDLTAYAGKRYNRGESGTSIGRISLFVDETANVVNPPMIELLNKGMEAGVHVTAAMQTIADLTVALGSEARARQALGNFNNLISLRTKDRETQAFVAETFGRTVLEANSLAQGSAASSELLPRFRASSTQTRGQRVDELIPCEWLGRLPNTEFFASVSGGRLYKGRMPIFACQED